MSGAQISVRLRPVKATPGEARGSRSGESGTPENFRPSLSPKITLQKPGKQTGLGRYEKVFRYETVKEVLKCLMSLEVSKIEAKARVCACALCIFICRCARMFMSMCARACMLMCTCVYVLVCMRVYKLMCTHVYMLVCTHMREDSLPHPASSSTDISCAV